MKPPILYLGDTSLTGAASYLAGVIQYSGWQFEYVPSNQRADGALFAETRRLFVLSDYPSVNMDAALQEKLCAQVAAGAGLLMIGGWESYHGMGGNWDGTPVAESLPVEIGGTDDRLNSDQPMLVRQVSSHPAVTGLPWKTRPPCIGGLNRFTAKRDATTILEACRFRAREDGDSFVFEPDTTHPLLVVGQHGTGRTAALATDAAPHWVGGLVDWGDGRVAAQAPGAEAIEVGDLYAHFLRQFLQWTGRL